MHACVCVFGVSLDPGLQNGGSHAEESLLEDNDDWSVDTSKEAVKSRMEKLTEGATSLALSDDLEKSSSERLNIFYKFVEVCVNAWENNCV